MESLEVREPRFETQQMNLTQISQSDRKPSFEESFEAESSLEESMKDGVTNEVLQESNKEERVNSGNFEDSKKPAMACERQMVSRKVQNVSGSFCTLTLWDIGNTKQAIIGHECQVEAVVRTKDGVFETSMILEAYADEIWNNIRAHLVTSESSTRLELHQA